MARRNQKQNKMARISISCMVFMLVALMSVQIVRLNRKNKEYIANLKVNEKYDEVVLKDIQDQFSKKLGVNLILKQELVDEVGIKLIVEDLGVEISFSQEKFIQDLRSHIMKAF